MLLSGGHRSRPEKPCGALVAVAREPLDNIPHIQPEHEIIPTLVETLGTHPASDRYLQTLKCGLDGLQRAFYTRRCKLGSDCQSVNVHLLRDGPDEDGIASLQVRDRYSRGIAE